MGLLLSLLLVFLLLYRTVGLFDRWGNLSLGRVLSGVAGAIALNYLVSTVTLPYYFNEKTVAVETRVPIFSLSEPQMSVGGTFVLGYGRVVSELKYLVYVRREDGAYLLQTLPGDAPVYEFPKGTSSAHYQITRRTVECETTRPTPGWVYVMWPLTCADIPWDGRVSLHVPSGTIRSSFAP